jgi:hypothetical protein
VTPSLKRPARPLMKLPNEEPFKKFGEYDERG